MKYDQMAENGVRNNTEYSSNPNDNRSQGPSFGLTPVEAQKVYVIASNNIFAQIKAGVWPPGTRLPPERELSDMLGISRSSVRQALSTLEAIGVLYSKRGVGHFVKEGAATVKSNDIFSSLIKQGDPQELLEARRIVEPEIARLSAIYRDSEDLTRLYTIIDEMKSKERSGDFGKYLDVDFNFHLALAYATHNPVIIDIEKIIVERMKAPPWQTATYTIVPKTLSTNRNEHLEILEAVASRKPKDARSAMIRHLSSIAKNLQNISAFSEVQELLQENQVDLEEQS